MEEPHIPNTLGHYYNYIRFLLASTHTEAVLQGWPKKYKEIHLFHSLGELSLKTEQFLNQFVSELFEHLLKMTTRYCVTTSD